MSPTPGPSATHAGTYLFLFVLVVFVLLPLTLMLWCAAEPLLVLQRGEAGTFRTAASHGDLTNVVTSTGVITVGTGFSALVGQPLFVRATNKYGLELCATGIQDHCSAVSGPWIGPMHPVLHPQHWYLDNFSAIRGSLPGILAMGAITAFFTGLAATVEFADDEPTDGPTDTGRVDER